MKETTQARVTVQWPGEEGDSSFWVGPDPDDENAEGPWTTIPANADDVPGLLVAWMKSQGRESFEAEVYGFGVKEVYSYHDGVWTSSDGSACQDGPELLPPTCR